MLTWSNNADNAGLLDCWSEECRDCMVYEEENGVLCIVISRLQNSLTKACEIIGRLGNEHVRERSMSRLEKEA